MLPGKIRFAALSAVAFFMLMATMAGQPPVCQEVAQPKKVEPPGPRLPAHLEAYETTRIFARIPGFAEDWNYDIGDRVKRGALLVKLYVPEVEQELKVVAAGVTNAQARVASAKSRERAAVGEVQAARAEVDAALATIRIAQTTVKQREAEFKRTNDLVAAKAIPESALDESRLRLSAANDAVLVVAAASAKAKAQALVREAKREQAEATGREAEAELMLAQAKYDQWHDWLHYRYIQAPFDGLITQRNCAKGDFVEPGAANKTPLFVMQRIDIIRVVFGLPERDVPFVKEGDAAEVEVTAFPGKKWPGTISRLSGAIDPKTGTMRAEVHLKNSDERLRPGMSASVAIRSRKRE